MSSHFSADGTETQLDRGNAKSCHYQKRRALQGQRATEQEMYMSVFFIFSRA